MIKYTIHSELFGPYENFIHILEETCTKKAIVFDPAWSAQHIADRLESLGLALEAIWITHAHHDHVNAVDALRKIYPVPIYACGVEMDFINAFTETTLPIAFMALPVDTIRLHDGDILKLGTIEAKVIHTPGHSSGSICFLLEDDLITGDTLFIDGCGRTDLPGSDPEALFTSLRKIIDTVPHHVTLHTGHAYGPSATATLASQLKTNPYLKRSERDEFIKYRMER